MTPQGQLETHKKQALEGIKVAEFTAAVAGPQSGKYLADLGATVVKVESMTKVDSLRVHFPMAGGVSGINRCASFALANSSKYSLQLNLNHPRGGEVAKRLIAWSDVVLENFVPKTMERWGFTYHHLKEIKPEVIMISLSTQGQTGPHAAQTGFGVMVQALGGITRLFGWPDREPVGTPIAYTDWIAPWYGVVAIVAALDYRRRTGKGLYIDLSQFEAGVSFLSPAILDYTTNGRVQTAMGNRCLYAAPHGAYHCQGDDRWCAIAVFSDEEWRGFCRVIGEPEWTKSPKFATFLGRKKNEGELDKLVEEWTVNHSPQEVMEMMQAAGVPAGVVQDGRDLHQDPQLRHRHHFWFLEHPEMGVTAYDALPFRFSRTPVELRRPAPCLGEHTEHVITEFLGMSDEEFTELLADGVFE